MGTIKQFIIKKTTPAHLTAQNGIHYWQERVLLSLLLTIALLGSLTWIPSVYLSIKESLWMVAGADTLILGFGLFLFFKPSLSYTFRAAAMAGISYVLGLILLFTLGPFGAGPLWLFFFPILTGVLMGTKPSVWALVLNGLTILFVGILIQVHQTELMAQFGFKSWDIAKVNPGMKWVVISANFMLLNILSTMLVTIVLTGLHKSLIELSVSEKKHRQIFENILDVYFESSLEGTILEISPSIEQVSSYVQTEIRGKAINEVYQIPQDRPFIFDLLIKENQVSGYELDLMDKSGEIRTCSINARLVRDDQDKPEKIIGIFRDISEQKAIAQREKELEDRLNRSQKMEALGLLAGGVAHDLNNVLSGIVTYPDLLLMDLPEKSPIAKGLKVIQSSGLRATEIVQDLLTLSRRGVVTREVVDLNEIVQDFLRMPEYEKILSFHPHVSVKTHIKATAPQLKGSAIHLQKTVMNLISNAAEAQKEGGVIQISTRNQHLEKPVKGYDRVHEGDYLVLTVEDQGEGICPEDVKRIFEPFFTKKVMGRSGTGLGMAVVWGTVQDHDGYIDVSSTPGKGTRFDLYFPVTDDLVETSIDPVDFKALMGNKERILIVDDVDHQRQIALIALKRLGYDPIDVGSGEEAVQFLKKHSADLVLLDMIMDPGIDGLETFTRIIQFKPDQKAVIASGFSQTRQVKKTMALGAGQYLKKPYTLEKIGLAIKKELARA
ncbi:MAG: response regulator [Desulfobacter sp.]|nr:response regulator [Desulfobacter sp.]WDP87066.1 MAG: response regulator [Desulfobacter sp.]